MDTEGSEVHISDLPAPIKADKAAEFLFTVRDPASCGPNCFAVRWAAVGCAGKALRTACDFWADWEPPVGQGLLSGRGMKCVGVAWVVQQHLRLIGLPSALLFAAVMTLSWMMRSLATCWWVQQHVAGGSAAAASGWCLQGRPLMAGCTIAPARRRSPALPAMQAASSYCVVTCGRPCR